MGGDGYFYYLDCGIGNTTVYMSKLFKMYTFIICSVLYSNDTSVKLEKKSKRKSIKKGSGKRYLWTKRRNTTTENLVCSRHILGLVDGYFAG